MTIPSSLVLLPLFIAFVLEVLSYYRLSPERIFSLPFVFLAAPLVFFLLFLGLSAAGLVPALWSALSLLAALAVLALAVRRTRTCLRRPAAQGT
ncbi:MAG TPA: hypothetical protein VJ779_07390 [Acetobacteraceae bacterium]|jgi:hypothetical protein|nr:hypothetical protein [Acetobacteraceae bacterium]